MWRQSSSAMATRVLALCFCTAFGQVSALVCFCNQPYADSSQCEHLDNATAKSLFGPSPALFSLPVCRVETVGGCCYRHLNKIPVANRNPAGDLRSDFYGCVEDLFHCMLIMQDSARDPLYSACDNGDLCNRQNLPYFSRPSVGPVKTDVVHAENLSEWHREVAIIAGVILTGLAVIATIIAVAFACFKQRSPTRSRGQRRQSRTHLLHNRASSTNGNDSPTLLKPLQTIYEDSPPNSPDIVPVRQPGGQQSDTNTEETEPACERVQPQRDGADLWQNSLPPAYHA